MEISRTKECGRRISLTVTVFTITSTVKSTEEVTSTESNTDGESICIQTAPFFRENGRLERRMVLGKTMMLFTTTLLSENGGRMT